MNSSDLKLFYKNYVEVGWVHSAQGLKGLIYVAIPAREAFWHDKWKTLNLLPLEKHNVPIIPVEFKISTAKPHSKQGKWGFIVGSPQITDRNQAEDLEGYKVFIESSFFVSRPGESIYLREVLDFSVVSPQGLVEGYVIGFSSNGAQDIIVVADKNSDLENNTFEVPFVKELIVSIDFKNKKIVMNIPEGLKL